MDSDTQERLYGQVYAAMAVADWIYHDTRLNCDGIATDRTKARLAIFNSTHGENAMFGVAAAWAIKAHWRLEDGLKRTKQKTRPTIYGMINQNDFENRAGIGPAEKRAFNSAIQFIQLISTDDLVLAEALFKAAYEASDEDQMLFMFAVLSISTLISGFALRMRA